MYHVLMFLLALGIFLSILALIAVLRATMHMHATAIWLQMQQQLNEPKMVQALHTVQSLAQTSSTNGHGPSAPPLLINGQFDAVQTVNRYFANVGTLVRDHVLDEDQVLSLMGPTLSDVWYASRSYRDLLKEKSVINHDDFDWLYTEWLNGEYQRRAWHTAA
ncbi:MAG: hypothetical protein H0X24_11270 [Ktedonobacterales bacterium]|nr:hypothetical protein [Ktedonobacterales bacterium]